MATLNMFFPGGVYPQDYNPPMPDFDYNPTFGELGASEITAVLSQTATERTLKLANGLIVKVIGAGFTYDANSHWTGGTVTELQVLQADGTTMVQQLTGMNSPAADFDAAHTGFDAWYFNMWLLNGDDTVNGSAGDDDIRGGDGTNTLNGGDGFDFMTGGAGVDTYNGGDGRDAVNFSESYFDFRALRGVTVNVTAGTLTDIYGNSETFTGIENWRLSHFADVITGSDLIDESIEGMGGNDTIDGGGGNDTVDYRNEARFGGGGVSVDLTAGKAVDGFGYTDTLFDIENARGTIFNDTLVGSAAANLLRGNNGNDFLDGRAGGDTMWGGVGNDTYVVDDVDDFIDEFADDGGGIDTVQSSISFDLRESGGQVFPDNGLENLKLLGSAGLTGIGNALANVLTGNSGNNVLSGLDGNDTLIGGLGADTLVGGLGNDVYSLENGSDVVSDAGGTADTITSTITRSLASYTSIERLTLLGASAINGTGNGLANIISGNNAANTLSGGVGNDTLTGLGGNDVLIGGAGRDLCTGGAGNDIFRLAAASDSPAGSGRDVFTDFDDSGDDRIDFSAVYGGTLTYRHNLAFTGAGQVRINDIAGADVIVEVNTGGTLAADIQVTLTATTLASMSASDFVL